MTVESARPASGRRHPPAGRRGANVECLRRSRSLLVMPGRWTARGGWTVEAIVLDDRPCYRVTWRGYLVGDAYCHRLADLERLLGRYGLDLADLVEDDEECE